MNTTSGVITSGRPVCRSIRFHTDLHTGQPLTHSDYTRSCIHTIFLLKMSMQKIQINILQKLVTYQNYMFHIYCTAHCNVTVQYKPTKCTFSRVRNTQKTSVLKIEITIYKMCIALFVLYCIVLYCSNKCVNNLLLIWFGISSDF